MYRFEEWVLSPLSFHNYFLISERCHLSLYRFRRLLDQSKPYRLFFISFQQSGLVLDDFTIQQALVVHPASPETSAFLRVEMEPWNPLFENSPS